MERMSLTGPSGYHRVVLFTYDFIKSFEGLYEELEGGVCFTQHTATIGSETLSMEIDGGEEQELMLVIFNHTRLLVRRVQLGRQHQGIFTELVTALVEYFEGTEVTEFEVESVLTPEMQRWCCKYGLSPVYGQHYDAAGLGGSYRIELSQLAEKLH